MPYWGAEIQLRLATFAAWCSLRESLLRTAGSPRGYRHTRRAAASLHGRAAAVWRKHRGEQTGSFPKGGGLSWRHLVEPLSYENHQTTKKNAIQSRAYWGPESSYTTALGWALWRALRERWLRTEFNRMAPCPPTRPSVSSRGCDVVPTTIMGPGLPL